MLILNFAHPFTEEHLAQIERLTGQKVERVIVVNSQIDPQQPWPPGRGHGRHGWAFIRGVADLAPSNKPTFS